jgi:hypothetical protein
VFQLMMMSIVGYAGAFGSDDLTGGTLVWNGGGVRHHGAGDRALRTRPDSA